MREEYEQNPSNIMEGTFDRREIGLEKLDQVEFELISNPKPGEVFVDKRLKGVIKKIDAYKNWGGDPYILFSKPIEVPVGGKSCLISGASFFSENRKMSSISFGIPAGPSSVQGACPASALPDTYRKHYALGNVDPRPMKWDEQICRKCYANKGNFTYELQQLYQSCRYEWIQSMIPPGENENELAEAMTACVDIASRNTKRRHADGEDPNFMRIHDSGDLFDLRYWRAWRKVCENLPHIQFWCPTRMWMLPVYTYEFQKGVPGNLALRPIAYHFNESAPVIPGLSDGSTANYYEERKGGMKVDPITSNIADWPCPAYVEVDGKRGESCYGALERVQKVWTGHNREALDQLIREMGPEERRLTRNCIDCRVCWLKKDWRVSYTAH